MKKCKGSRLVHGMTGSRVYRIWKNMKRRCFAPSHPNYKHYGGRGIIVCPEWLSFLKFFADMGCPPTDKHELDRIDNNGPYCKANCCWVTHAENSKHKRNTIFVTEGSLTMSLADWARHLGRSYLFCYNRYRQGLPLQREPRKAIYGKTLTAFGQTLTIPDWARMTGLGICTIHSRKRRGLSDEDALKPLGTFNPWTARKANKLARKPLTES